MEINTKLRLIVDRIRDAIEEVTGLRLTDDEIGSRSEDEFFARMIFAHFCILAGMTSQMVSLFTSRDRTTILHQIKRYSDEYKYNQKFCALACKVNQILNPDPCNSEITKAR